jgi:hypothetical protein
MAQHALSASLRRRWNLSTKRMGGCCRGMLDVQHVAQGSPQGRGELGSAVMTILTPNLLSHPWHKAFAQSTGTLEGGLLSTKFTWMWLNLPVGTGMCCCHCWGSGSACFWASWIRIRIH